MKAIDKTKIRKILLFLIITSSLLYSIGNDLQPHNQYNYISQTIHSNVEINIVVSMPTIAIIVREIVGNITNVETILPDGVDPHSYQLTPSDIEKISKADVLVLADIAHLTLEESILKNAPETVIFVDYSNYTENGAFMISVPGITENFHGFWTHPDNAMAIAKTIYDVLTSIDSENAILYEQNFNSFKSRMNDLKRAIAKTITDYDLEGTGVAVAVPGIAYFAYMLNMSIEAMFVKGPNRFVNASEIAEIEEYIAKGKITMILCPEIMKDTKPGTISKQISEETGISVIYIRIFSTHKFNSYIDFMSYNLGLLEGALNKVQEYQIGTGVDISLLFSSVGVLSLIAILEGYFLFRYKRRLEEEA